MVDVVDFESVFSIDGVKVVSDSASEVSFQDTDADLGLSFSPCSIAGLMPCSRSACKECVEVGCGDANIVRAVG